MKAILCIVLLAVGSPAFADSGSGSGGSASPPAGSGSGASGSGAGAGSGSAPAAGAGSSAEPADAGPGSEARKACAAALNADEKFAESVMYIAEKKLSDKMNSEQVLKDLCVLRDHSEAQADVATNKKHVLMAYIAMWLVAAGFVVFLWRKQQALKLEIERLRADLDAATKDTK